MMVGGATAADGSGDFGGTKDQWDVDVGIVVPADGAGDPGRLGLGVWSSDIKCRLCRDLRTIDDRIQAGLETRSRMLFPPAGVIFIADAVSVFVLLNPPTATRSPRTLPIVLRSGCPRVFHGMWVPVSVLLGLHHLR